MCAFRLAGLSLSVVSATLVLGSVNPAFAAKIESGTISVQTSNLGNLSPSDVSATSTVSTTDALSSRLSAAWVRPDRACRVS